MCLLGSKSFPGLCSKKNDPDIFKVHFMILCRLAGNPKIWVSRVKCSWDPHMLASSPSHCPIAQIYSCLLQRKTPRRHNFLHTRLFSEIYLENSYRHHLQDERKERKMLHILSAFLYHLIEYRKSFWTSPFWRWKKIEVTLGAQCCCSGGSSEITSLVQHSGMKLPFERSIEIKFYFHCRCFFRLILTTQNQSWAGFSPYFKVEPGISCRPNWDRWQDYHPLEMPPSPLALCVRGN